MSNKLLFFPLLLVMDRIESINQLYLFSNWVKLTLMLVLVERNGRCVCTKSGSDNVALWDHSGFKNSIMQQIFNVTPLLRYSTHASPCAIINWLIPNQISKILQYATKLPLRLHAQNDFNGVIGKNKK